MPSGILHTPDFNLIRLLYVSYKRQIGPIAHDILASAYSDQSTTHRVPEGDPVPRPPIYPDRAGTAEKLPRVLLALFRLFARNVLLVQSDFTEQGE